MTTYHFSLSLSAYPSNITFIFDLETKTFIEIDHHFLTKFGLCEEDLNLDRFWSYIFPEDKEHLMNSFSQILTDIAEPSIEFRLNINNEIKWIRLTPFKVKSSNGYLILGNAEDISAKVNTLFTAQKYANKKNSVLNVLSHDLKGNLSVLKTIAQVMAKKIQDEKFTQFTTTIAKIISHSVDLINDLMTREFMENVNVQLVKKRIDIAEKLRNYIDEFRFSENQSQRKFEFSTTHKNVFVDLDEPKFMQILNNLMSNALKFTKDSGVISLKVKQQPNSILFVFADNGIGIPKKQQKHIFKKFSKAGRPGLNGETSVGLGLNIVKTIVKWHKGNIWFESEENKGTTFFIEIPKKQQ